MLYLVNDILDFSQMESKTIILNRDKVDLKALLEECRDLLLYQAEIKGLTIDLEIEDGAKTSIRSDPNRCRQIIVNLLSNAIKYTTRGSICLWLVNNPSFDACIQVKDSGVGIRNDQLANLFENFKKITSNRQLNKYGVGLGLTLSKNLAMTLGGDITVESTEGEGSTFTVVLKELPKRQSELSSFISRQLLQRESDSRNVSKSVISKGGGSGSKKDNIISKE